MSHSDEKVVAYTASGQPLTQSQYKKRVEEGILQCKEGKCTSLEQLSEELGYDDADLSDWQKQLIDKRLECIAQNPDRLRPIEELFDELDRNS